MGWEGSYRTTQFIITFVFAFVCTSVGEMRIYFVLNTNFLSSYLFYLRINNKLDSIRLHVAMEIREADSFKMYSFFGCFAESSGDNLVELCASFDMNNTNQGRMNL